MGLQNGATNLITTHAGDCLNLTDHADQLVRLGQEDFRSPENGRFLMKLGRCITLAAGWSKCSCCDPRSFA
jgi:hypothetical protein